jgi:hypothetical protein
VAALVRLLNNEYFTRLWVVQEVLLAQEVRVLCGMTWVMLKDLETCAEQKLTIVHSSIMNESLFLLWDRRHNRNYRNLQQCLDRYSMSKCKDPRDKVYALRGVLHAHESEHLLVDYKKPVLEVFYDAVRVIAHNSLTRSVSSVGWGYVLDAKQVKICLRLADQMLSFDEMTKVQSSIEIAGGDPGEPDDASVRGLYFAMRWPSANQLYRLQAEPQNTEEEDKSQDGTFDRDHAKDVEDDDIVYDYRESSFKSRDPLRQASTDVHYVWDYTTSNWRPETVASTPSHHNDLTNHSDIASPVVQQSYPWYQQTSPGHQQTSPGHQQASPTFYLCSCVILGLVLSFVIGRIIMSPP